MTRFPGILPAVTTPFGPDGAVDAAALATNVAALLEAGVHGLVATGTMGEAGSLTRDERAGVVATVVEAAAGRVPVVAGVSAGTPGDAAGFARDAADAGAVALMSLPPLGYRGDARRIPAILAAAPGLEVLVGGDDWALEGLCSGATGWVSGVAVCAPADCVALYDACRSGDLAQARALYGRLLPLGRLDMTPRLVQFFKAAQDALGFAGGPVRPPRLPLDDADRATLRAALDALGAAVPAA